MLKVWLENQHYVNMKHAGMNLYLDIMSVTEDFAKACSL